MKNEKQKIINCKKCNEEFEKDKLMCPKCNKINFSSDKMFVIIILSIILFTIFVGIIPSIHSNEKKYENNSKYDMVDQYENDSEEKEESNSDIIDEILEENDDIYTLDETFKFDDLEITLGSNITFTKINNKYSDNYNKPVIRMPVTVKNIKSETHGLNMFDYEFYGANGTKVDNASSYFDDCVDYAGDLRSGASYTKYFYFIYDGDGSYAIEFDDWDNKITVEFNIKK